MSRVIHFEILSRDPRIAVRFYEQVFGWKIEKWEGAAEYWLVTTGKTGHGIDGAVMQRQVDQAVINTIDVDDFDAAQTRIIRAGGRKVMGPHDIPGVGRHGYFADPDGTIFGVMQAISRTIVAEDAPAEAPAEPPAKKQKRPSALKKLASKLKAKSGSRGKGAAKAAPKRKR